MTKRFTLLGFLLLAAGSSLAYVPRSAGLSLPAVSRPSIATDYSPLTDHCSPLTAHCSPPTVQPPDGSALSPVEGPPDPTSIHQPAPFENPHICGFYCGNNPVNNIDPLGLDWMLTVKDGHVVVYENGSIFAPKIRGVTTVGRYVESSEYDYMSSQGWGKTRDLSVVFEHGGSRYKMSYGTVSDALRNIPDDLTDKLLAANATDRALMLYDFLTQGVAPSCSVRAKIAGTLDSAHSIFAGSTAFGNPAMNSHGMGGLFQELLGVDSRDPTYLGITKHIETGTQIGSTVMVTGGAYAGTKQGLTLGVDTSLRPGTIVLERNPVLSVSRYPEATQHIVDARNAGHPYRIVIYRLGAASNRKASLKGYDKVRGMQLDEYPPAMFREGGAGASVRPISPSDNMGAGASLGNQLLGVPDGTQVIIIIGN